MKRQFIEPQLVIATHNPGKLEEIRLYLKDYDIELLFSGDLGLPEPEETERTYQGNARLKAIAAMEASGLPALADDSGFAIHALGGQPGVDTALWAGPQKDYAMAIARMERELQAIGATDTSTTGYCALALAWPDGYVEEYLGKIEGKIVFPPQGDQGFGYDPIFMLEGFSKTFGEMSAVEKHILSHRGVAFKKLLEGSFQERPKVGRV